jgi:hypothetical protein
VAEAFFPMCVVFFCVFLRFGLLFGFCSWGFVGCGLWIEISTAFRLQALVSEEILCFGLEDD